MRDISIADLAELVVADVHDADKRIEKMFDWHFSREMEVAKWILGLAATVGAALLVAVFKTEIEPNWWQAILLVAIPASTATYGLVRLFKARSIQRQFVAALRIQADLARIRPFLVRYRQAKR